VLIANYITKFKLSTHQLLDLFECDTHIVEFHANYKPFHYSTGNITVRSVMIHGSGKLIALQTKDNLIYLPMRIIFRLLHLKKLLRNNVLEFIDMQLGIRRKPVTI
jgi:hypothetical protein